MSEEKKGTKSSIVKSQAEYTGNSHFDYVDVIIIKDSDFYKKGDTDRLHPATAAIFKAKGLIGDYEKNIKTKDSVKLLTDIESEAVNTGNLDLDGKKIKD